MSDPFVQVDAFAEEPFTGNPAAVFVLAEPRDEGWMQRVAREMNLAETAFLVRRAEGYDLRWFTPTIEVDLCGHATLASAHHLWESGELAPTEPARFHTRSGLLTASLRDGLIWMDMPAKPVEPAETPPDLAAALGTDVRAVTRNEFDLLVEVGSEAAVRDLLPDLDVIGRYPVRGVIVTARADNSRYDFVSRFFAPAVGVPEDPVTGSAHCALGPYWGALLGRDELTGWQASPRGGMVRMRLSGDRVLLAGRAVTVIRGELL